MTYVLTLIGNKTQVLDAGLVDKIAQALGASAPDWLAPGYAADLFVAGEPGKAQEKVHTIMGHTPVDCVVQPAAGRRKKLLVADMDSTIIQQECIDEIASTPEQRAQVAAITERAMRGETDFESALRERATLLRGLPLSRLQQVYDHQIVETPGGRSLCATMKAHGATCALVSGGFTFFTERVARAVGFQCNVANVLEEKDGYLTGTVASPVLGMQAKVETLIQLRETQNLVPGETLAVGDGANDLGMIREAGLGVAFHAKPVLAAGADAQIRHGDLDTLLFIQGYRQEEILPG